MSSRAATVSDNVLPAPASPRAMGNAKHEEAVQMLEAGRSFRLTTTMTHQRKEALAELAREQVLDEGTQSADGGGLYSSGSFFAGAATTLMGSFTSPKEAEALMEARRAREGEKAKERKEKLRKVREAVLRCRVLLVGDSGAGKTSLKSCIVQTEVLKTLPDVTASTSSGSSTYYYNGPKGDKLEVTFIDGGPLPPSSGNPCHMYSSDSVVVLVVNLSMVKQRAPKKGAVAAMLGGFSSSSNSSSPSGDGVFLHPKDLGIILGYLHALAASAPGSSVILVATHMDLLSDGSPAGVESVLRYLHEKLSAEIQQMQDALDDMSVLRLLACFAVSCHSRQCISENRGSGPATIGQMWDFICELVIKSSKISEAAGRPFGCGVLQSSNSMKVQRLLHSIKNELYEVFVDFHAFQKAMFTLGISTQAERAAIVQSLIDSGEVMQLHGQQGNSHRPHCLLLYPHLLSRASSIALLYTLWVSYPVTARAKLLPGLDIAACDTADVGRQLAEGYPSSRLLVELSRCLSLIKRAPDERTELYVTLLLQSDFMIAYQAYHRRHHHHPNCPHRNNSMCSAPGDDIDDDDDDDLTSADEFNSMSHGLPPRYIIPSFMWRTYAPSALTEFQNILEGTGCYAIGRRVVFAVPVPGLFHCLQCRLGSLLVSARTISKDGMLMQMPPPSDRACRVLLTERQCSNERGDMFFDIVAVTSMNTVDPVPSLFNAMALINNTMLELVQHKFAGAKTVVFPSRPNTFASSIVEEMERLEALHREPTQEEWSVVFAGSGDNGKFSPEAVDSIFTTPGAP